MRQTSFANFRCSLSRSLELVGDWWSPLILRDIFLGLNRFDEIAEDLGISRNLLTSRLSDLVDGGILAREPYSEHPPRDRFVLTEAGRELVPIFAALTAWGDRWVAPEAGPPLLFKHRGHGHRLVPQVSCAHCGEPVDAGDVEPIPGPGAGKGPGSHLVAKLFRERLSRGPQPARQPSA
ncbi:MAG TPA: helix-turn-helix domain-containing protein [Candidatus Dormibacteraeota bacterium]|jgi:DNA-binding HxlR family transcriptional regulator|nr:helix-turn-helix domain-containing protein [Candidatus Dormibacteraeota bacterium]HEX2682242.1 helix-turn-helix domain-containing protein [Candidatus Dormibacteraeota bacterium]